MKKLCYAFLFILFLFAPFIDGYSKEATLVIVANMGVPVTQISVRDLTDFYLKKKRFWSDGTPVRPIDWAEGQPPREFFLSHILKKSEGELAQYWMGQKLYTGDQAPMSLDSGDSICNLVATIKGGVGYFLASSEALKSCTGVKRIGEVE